MGCSSFHIECSRPAYQLKSLLALENSTARFLVQGAVRAQYRKERAVKIPFPEKSRASKAHLLFSRIYGFTSARLKLEPLKYVH